MLFQYIGDKDAPRRTTVYGYEFELFGEAVEVEKTDVITKLKGNVSFIEASEGLIKEPEVVVETPKPTVSKTFDLPPLKEDLSDLTEEELEKLTSPKKKNK